MFKEKRTQRGEVLKEVWPTEEVNFCLHIILVLNVLEYSMNILQKQQHKILGSAAYFALKKTVFKETILYTHLFNQFSIAKRDRSTYHPCV